MKWTAVLRMGKLKIISLYNPKTVFFKKKKQTQKKK